jgi:hypothetical protein
LLNIGGFEKIGELWENQKLPSITLLKWTVLE